MLAVPAIMTPIAAGDQTGVWTRHADGRYTPGITGGAEELSDADSDQSAVALAPAVPSQFIMVPTADRHIILPSAYVARGTTFWVMNRKTTLPMTQRIEVKASDGGIIRYVLPGQNIPFTAIVNTPNSSEKWFWPGGRIFTLAHSIGLSAIGNFFSETIPAGTLYCDGQYLEIKSLYARNDSNIEIQLQLNGVVLIEAGLTGSSPFIYAILRGQIIRRSSSTAIVAITVTGTTKTGSSNSDTTDTSNHHTQAYDINMSGLNWASDMILRMRVTDYTAGTSVFYSTTIDACR